MVSQPEDWWMCVAIIQDERASVPQMLWHIVSHFSKCLEWNGFREDLDLRGKILSKSLKTIWSLMTDPLLSLAMNVWCKVYHSRSFMCASICQEFLKSENSHCFVEKFVTRDYYPRSTRKTQTLWTVWKCFGLAEVLRDWASMVQIAAVWLSSYSLQTVSLFSSDPRAHVEQHFSGTWSGELGSFLVRIRVCCEAFKYRYCLLSWFDIQCSAEVGFQLWDKMLYCKTKYLKQANLAASALSKFV